MNRNASAIVRTRLRGKEGLNAVLSRGTSSCPVVVTMGRSEAVATGLQDVRVQSKAQEIFIQASSYCPTGVPTQPEDNDKITVTMSDGSVVDFDIRPPSNGLQCFNLSGSENTEWRLHTRRVSSIPTEV